MKENSSVNPHSNKTYTLIGADNRPYTSETPGEFGGHRKTKVYGHMDCSAALRAIAKGGYVAHRVFFANEQAAIAAGYRPCGVCMREEYKKWKSQNKQFRTCFFNHSNKFKAGNGMHENLAHSLNKRGFLITKMDDYINFGG